MSYILGGHDLQPNCTCRSAKILFVLTTDMHGYIDSTLGLLHQLESSVGADSSVEILDLSRLLPLYSSRRRDGSSPITQFTAQREIFQWLGRPRAPANKLEASIGTQSSIDSDLYSFFLDNNLGKNYLAKRLRKKLDSASSFTYQEVTELFNIQHYCSSIVLNGRHAISNAVAMAANKKSVPMFFWEHRQSDNKIYFCDHPPQDFFKRQLELVSFSPTSEQIKDAENWLLKRTKLQDANNPFSNRWLQEPEPNLPKNIDLAFFTSSQDEYWSLGDLFPKKIYTDFYEKISEYLESHYVSDSQYVIRMHPNTVNKAVPYVYQELKKAIRLRNKFPNIRILWPTQNANSYDVIRRAKYVVVENSTIGVEAAFLGVPVRYLSQSIYVGLSSETMKTPFTELQSTLSSQLELNKNLALKDVALIRSHYSMSYEPDANFVWNKWRLIKSIDSPWALVFLVYRLLNPRINRLMIFIASRLPATKKDARTQDSNGSL